MVGVAWFYSKDKGVFKKTPFFIIKTTPTITLSAVFWLGGGCLYYLYYPAAAQHKIQLEPRAF